MINTTSITETIYTAVDIFGLFVKSALLMDVIPNIHYTLSNSKKDPDLLWHNITNNDDNPPPDDDANDLLKGEYEGEEGLAPHEQIQRGVALPCIDNPLNDAQPHPPALPGSLPISQ